MAYSEFAYFYDSFNEDADYGALFNCIKRMLTKHGVSEGLVVDIGCGTGELTLLLRKAGYDIIGVDMSCEMLSILREKAYEDDISDLLLLQQDILKLDLYGTVKAAVSTFDTLNHIGPYGKLEKAISRISMFIEPGGLFVFDINTPYKHEQVLGDNTFVLQAEDSRCEWSNKFDYENQRTSINVQITDDNGNSFSESFYEYSYTLQQIQAACEKAGLKICEVCDGESFTQLREDTQRYLIVALKE